MKLTLAVAATTAFAASSAAATAAAPSRPPMALSVSPARLGVTAPAARRIELRNLGADSVVVDVARSAIDRRSAAEWLHLRPRRLVLRSGAKATFTMRVRRAGATPGDHQLRVLLLARPVGGGRVRFRMRLGVVIRVRVPGRIVRRLELRGVRVERRRGERVLLVSIGNRGNVTEQLRGRLTVTLVRTGRLLSRLQSRGFRELFPGRRAVIRLPYAGRARGLVTAAVKLRLGGRLRPMERRYRIRL